MLSSLFMKMQAKYKLIFLTTLLTALTLCGFYSLSPPVCSKRTMPRTVADPAPAPDYDSSLLRRSLYRLGYTLDDLPLRNSLWTNNIHLCVMFNLKSIKPNEKVLNLLISFYFPFFRHISLIFDGQPNYNSEWIPGFVNVLSCDSYFGWYQHKCIRKCIQQNESQTEGFLYIAEDMFINITKMADLPKDKIWFLQNNKRSFSWVLNPGAKGWDWPRWGKNGNSLKFNKTIQSMPSKWKQILENHHGFPDYFNVTAISDIVFIPQVAVPKILPVLDHIILQGDLFCEIATALAVNVASHDVVKMEYGYLWRGERSVAGIERKSTSAHFVHPMKLGIRKHAELWLKYMEQQLNFTLLGYNNL